ncbi:hypothetical protein CVIRNUC_010262 [Coccomyxa viridis]|uniref:Uncharacterized protein n=1 Tax=Coccomyxa viridis TaxID=1274662 RepID=A0AAV1IJP4_9CHLO|nr:hypothetical protein CVIRNUC_010262 [Coccomyxa viridis]
MSGDQPVAGTAGVTGGGAAASDVHGLKTGAQYPSDGSAGAHAGGTASSTTVPATAGYSGGGATVSDEHGVATGKQYPGNTPQSTTVPATAGYSGGGATVSDEHGVATGKQYPGNTPQSQTPQGSATGAAAGRQSVQGSIIGAGKHAPLNAVPVSGATPGNNEKPSAQDKARSKTAVLAAGMQEDLASLREKLTVKDGVQAPPPGSAGTQGQTYQPSTQEGGKASFTDKAKAYAVKAIDHTNAALEGAKQKVTQQTTVPAGGGGAAGSGAQGSAGTGTTGVAPSK